MTKEEFEKHSNWWVGRKLRNGAILGALSTLLFLWISCSSNGWKSTEKTKTKVEQKDDVSEKTPEKDWIVKNPDWSYSFYNYWTKVWENYKRIELGSWFNGFHGYKENWKQCLLNNAWDVISCEYDNIVDIREKSGKLEFIAWKDGKYLFVSDWEEYGPYDGVYPLTIMPYEKNLKGFSYRIWEKDYVYFNWTVVWPLDDFDDVKLVEWTENWIAVMAKNDWENVLYYNENVIWRFPLSYNSDQRALTLWSLKLLNDKPCYIIYDTINSKIVYWDKKIETNYKFIDNIQESNWEIIYVWRKFIDEESDELYIVVGDKHQKLDVSKSDIEKLTDPKTNLGFFATYWYFHD